MIVSKKKRPRILILGPNWVPYEVKLFKDAIKDLIKGDMYALDKWHMQYDFSQWDSDSSDNGWRKWIEFSKLILEFPPAERGLDWEFFNLNDVDKTPVAYPQICVIRNKTGKWRMKRCHVPDAHAVFLRDFYSCSYCGRQVIPKKGRSGLNDPDTATVDHIVPVSRWDKWAEENKPSFGREHWKNKCTSCRECNHRKGNRMNDEIGYVLKKVAFSPTWSVGKDARVSKEHIKESWIDFLYPEGKWHNDERNAK